MGRRVIVGYRLEPGKAEQLMQLVASQVDRLRAEGLATDRPSVVMQAEDGTVVEVFEWKSKQAIEGAHGNAAVLARWQEDAAVCDYVPLSQLPKARQLFSEFTPVDR